MKTLFNLSTDREDLGRFRDTADLLTFMDGFDGIELTHLQEDNRGILPGEKVIGFHMGFFPYWVDLWNGGKAALMQEFGSWENCERYYGGLERGTLLRKFRQDLALAHRYKAEYVVFHISDAAIAETFAMEYRHSDEEVIDAAAELLNQLFAEEDGPLALLLENLWQPGLTFTRPEMTKRLLDSIQYSNKGLMLDTGHLLHTNTALRTQEEGLRYIHQLLDVHGPICSYIRGVHLHQSLTGEYCEQTRRNLPPLHADYWKRYEQMFWHAFRTDRHLPFTCDGIGQLIDRISPEYLVFEFMTENRAQHLEFLERQKHALRKQAAASF